MYTDLVDTIKCSLGGLPVFLKNVIYTDVEKANNVFSVAKGWLVSLAHGVQLFTTTPTARE